MHYLQQLLLEIGLEPERVRMVNMSAAMAAEFVTIASEFTEEIKALGTSPLRSTDRRDANRRGES